MTTLSFINGSICTAEGVRSDAAFTIEGDRIASIGPAGDDAIDLEGGWLLPGFIDTQVNGGGGTLFNNDISVAGLRTIAAAHARYGTTALLPTLISETPDLIALALDTVDAAIEAGVPGIIGVHIEGPFLNAARKGIHDAAKFREIDAAMLALLTRQRRGVVMITLAPERTNPETIAALASAGVLVSAGHSEADYATTIAAFDAGLSGITHLFNAMPPMQQRAPGIIGAALDDPRPWCGLIVDGVHVAPAVLRIALRARGLDRMVLVTDAMSSVGTKEKDFVLQGKHIHVDNGICRFDDGTLAGSDLDMATAVANCVTKLGLTMPEAAQLATTSPATFLRLDHERGAIGIGLRADLVWIDADRRPRGTWIGGEAVRQEMPA